ncbi:hypothetical protein LTR93_010764, partial [Exophiala xenobiotica]
ITSSSVAVSVDESIPPSLIQFVLGVTLACEPFQIGGKVLEEEDFPVQLPKD